MAACLGMTNATQSVMAGYKAPDAQLTIRRPRRFRHRLTPTCSQNASTPTDGVCLLHSGLCASAVHEADEARQAGALCVSECCDATSSSTGGSLVTSRPHNLDCSNVSPLRKELAQCLLRDVCGEVQYTYIRRLRIVADVPGPCILTLERCVWASVNEFDCMICFKNYTIHLPRIEETDLPSAMRSLYLSSLCACSFCSSPKKSSMARLRLPGCCCCC